MKKILVSLLGVALVISGCCGNKIASNTGLDRSAERHLRNVRQLTSEGTNGEAYFSWDDQQLIFQSNRGGYACDKIWTMKTDGSDKKMVSPDHGANTCSYFFPDGRIIYSSTSYIPGECPPKPAVPGGYVWPLYPYNIFTANADGTAQTRITNNNGYDAEPIVSPDGRQVVFGSQREGDFDIYIMNADGSDLKRLTDRIGYDGGPWFSPDGKRIAWRAWYPETAEEKAQWKDCMEKKYIVPVALDLWVMNSDGSEKKMVLHNGATNWAPSWHPDGKRLIFSSNMDDWHEDIKKFGHNFELYLINIDGSGLERLTFNDVFDSFPMFSNDGKKIAFGSNRNKERPRSTDIFIADWIE